MFNFIDLFANLYPFSQMLVLFFMAIWYLYDLKDSFPIWVKISLLLGLILYFVSFLANYEFQMFMIIWFFRDVLIYLMGIKLLDILFKFKWIVISGLVVAGIGFWVYQQKYGNPWEDKDTKISSFNPDAEFLVEFSSPEKLREFQQKFMEHKFTLEPAFPQLKSPDKTDLDDFYVLDFTNIKGPNQTEIDKLTYELEKLKLINYIEYNDPIQVWPNEAEAQQYSSPNSTYVAVNDELAANQWALSTMKMDKLVKVLKNKIPVKKSNIFILDTGVDAKHSDLSANYKSFRSSYNRDTDKHGTHCAGIAAAVTNNKLGIASLNLTNKYTSITSITVLPKGSGTQESIVDGMIEAADNGAEVISMSLGGLRVESKQKIYEKAIQYANQKGAIVVVAAGNDGRSASNNVPASCEGVIVVAATDNNDRIARFSSTLKEQNYRIAAPGVDILSTIPNNKYNTFSGTSMATPLVAGLVGILKSLKPSLNTQEVWQILDDTGIYPYPEKDESLSGKIIQPAEAILQLDQKTPGESWILSIWETIIDFLYKVFLY